jgi:putative transcriptional regulator
MKTRLRLLRAEREWTQAQLAQKVGVSRGAINSYETGRYAPSLRTAFRIAHPFDKKIADVFLQDTPETHPTTFHELGRTL